MTQTDTAATGVGARDRLSSAADLATTYLVPALIVVLIALRVHIVWSRPIWLDEVFTATAASSLSWGDLLHNWVMKDVHPPLYLAFMRIVVHLFGTSNVVLRLPSLVFGTGAIAAVYFGLKDVWGARCASLAALFVAAVPNTIFYSAEARSYALVLLLSSLLAVFAIRFALNGSRRALVGLTISAVLLILTHYFGLALVGSVYVWLFLQNRRALPALSCSALVCALLGLPWLAYHLPFLLTKSGGHFWIPQTSFLDGAFVVLHSICGEPGAYLGPQIELAAAIAVALLTRRTNRPGVALALGLLGLVLCDALILQLISLHTPIIVPRYFLVFTPFTLIASALLIDASGSIAVFGFALAVPLLITLPWATFHLKTGFQNMLSWEASAADLHGRTMNSLVFVLVDPLVEHLTPEQLKAVGTFVFKRDGLRIDPTVLDVAAPSYTRDLDSAMTTLPRPLALVQPVTAGPLSELQTRETAVAVKAHGGTCHDTIFYRVCWLP